MKVIARRLMTYQIDDVKMKLTSRRIRSMDELLASGEGLPAVCGPSPASFAARHGLKLSKSYLTWMHDKQAGGNGARKFPKSRSKPVAALTESFFQSKTRA
jgi:hypothetical protein